MSGNILNFNSKKIKLELSDSEYYDFRLVNDKSCGSSPCGSTINNLDGEEGSECLAVHFDFNDPNIYPMSGSSAGTIYSLATWGGAVSNGLELDTVGLTGIDNGLITFNKFSGDTENDVLFSTMTSSVLVIPSGETRFFMNPVSGMSGDYVYPMFKSSGDTGEQMNFCGGFYQGFYKVDGTDYQVLPTRVRNEWAAEFWLKKSDDVCSSVTGTTLNDIYPENKGIFFYMGTRSENKFWNQFEGLNTGSTSGCTSGATEWCTPVKEVDVSLIDDESGLGVSLNPPQTIITELSNQFLIYGRARRDNNMCGNEASGLGNKTAHCFSGDSIFITTTKHIQTDFRNPFLIYGRARRDNNMCGNEASGLGNKTAHCISGLTEEVTELDWAADVVDNAIAFMIKDDGSIGYRLLTFTGDCVGDTYVSGCSIEERFSPSGTVIDNQWTHISIRFVTNTLEDCDLITKGQRKGRLMFYVGCKLKFVVEDFDEFIAKRLDDHWKKQVGVPFNFSLGGGSQGLIDSMTFDGQDPSDKELCIESNFAGSFIGSISQFRFNICGLNWCELKTNCEEECCRYNTCSNCKPNC